MQSISIKQLFQCQGLIYLSYKIITYLDTQFISSILNTKTVQQHNKSQQITLCEQAQNMGKNNKQKNLSYFYDLIKAEYYVKNYLNKVDRTMYYNFYQNQQFILKEKQYIQYIVTKQALQHSYKQNKQHQIKQIKYLRNIDKTQNKNKQQTTLGQCIDTFKTILSNLQKQIQLSQDELQQIKRIFLDPCLPLPKMKRQNQGIYCNSPFQLYLVSLRFNHQNDAFDQYSPFQSIRQIIRQNEQSLSSLFSVIQQQRYLSPLIYQNVHFVRYTAYEICLQNYEQLKIQGNTVHNFIVYLFTLTDVYIRSILKYIQLIKDPIYKFVQIICRYSVFRSFVMQIQESLGFLFDIYETLYSDSIRDSVSNKPKFCFWRPAMSKWYLKMNNVHQQTNMVYFMLLTQMRQNNIIQIFQNDKYPILKQSQIIIKNKLQMNDFLQNIKENISRNKINVSDKSTISQRNQISRHPDSSLFTDFFKQNSQLLQVLTCQYVQYMIDLSIDQFQVHWCGHSEQNLDKTYFDFQNQFLSYNKSYNESLLQCLKQGNLTSQSDKLIIKFFNIFIQEDISLLEEKNVKPVTLNIIIQNINKQYFTENPQDPNHNPISSSNDIFNYQHQLRCNPIFFDFTFKDQNLKYFNQKAKIIRLLSDDDKCYFSIPPLLSVQQIMVKSIDTKNTQNQQNNQFNQTQEKLQKHQNSFQYISDAQGEELQETKKKDEKNKKAERKSSLDQIDQTKSIVILKKTQSLQNQQQIDEQNIQLQSLVKQSFLISSNSTKNSSNEYQQQWKMQVSQKSFYSDSIKIQQQADKKPTVNQKSQKNVSMS